MSAGAWRRVRAGQAFPVPSWNKHIAGRYPPARRLPSGLDMPGRIRMSKTFPIPSRNNYKAGWYPPVCRLPPGPDIPRWTRADRGLVPGDPDIPVHAGKDRSIPNRNACDNASFHPRQCWSTPWLKRLRQVWFAPKRTPYSQHRANQIPLASRSRVSWANRHKVGYCRPAYSGQSFRSPRYSRVNRWEVVWSRLWSLRPFRMEMAPSKNDRILPG